MTDLCYRAAPPAALRATMLGELTAIFDRRSAQTHVVAPPLPEMLAVMGDGQWDAAALAARLDQQFDMGQGDTIAIIAERLAELEAMGLVLRG